MNESRRELIRIKDVKKVYTVGSETLNVLDGVSLNVEEGEFVAIVGPSGSGKSTLMNMIGCLDTPGEGAYFLDGYEISKQNDNMLAKIRNEKIGFIFQSFNLLSKLSAIENVELPLIYRGINSKKRKELSALALEKVGLKERMNHRPTELSGGQQQRVAIARALAGEPPVLLADEPTGALDSKTGKDILQMLQKLNQSGHTIILITHDMYIAEQSNRVVRIQDGRIVGDSGVKSG
ncbi:ABC transporter ATP-binding protein [Paenibacillus sp. YN15]|uniref:ABC transporter ATP-binding protein n=1 Tax=Paenibacillus sp. YN15 TaxID=1742774 RepID=UPI000DCC25E7|nr:ABC transporter ATP-binding protein [Paenibacillus sp. YN15]RAV05025.1 macrolide ABC transporter ATP-binding protein [Paenibacillus sp. YN15]